MKTTFASLSFLFLILFSGCSSPAPRITQIATIDSLLAGAYDGTETLGELKRHGDLGIGTFHQLDGEMVLLDGTVYQVRGDGSVKTPPDEATTPFAAVINFKPQQTFSITEKQDSQRFLALLDSRISSPNALIALRVSGSFPVMHTRSVPPQEKPYRPLAEVTQNQPEFHFQQIPGTIVGFRLPPFVKGINVPGWHIHFISDDRASGGHILDFTIDTDARVELTEVHDFRMLLPENSEAFAAIDFSRDRSKELEAAESAKTAR